MFIHAFSKNKTTPGTLYLRKTIYNPTPQTNECKHCCNRKQNEIVKSREVKGCIVHITVRRKSSGRYFVSLLVETEVQELSKTYSSIGIDVGLKVSPFCEMEHPIKILSFSIIRSEVSKAMREVLWSQL